MTITPSSTRFRTLGLAAAIILVVAACGSTSGGSEDADAPQVETSVTTATTQANDGEAEVSSGHDAAGQDDAADHDDSADHDETVASQPGGDHDDEMGGNDEMTHDDGDGDHEEDDGHQSGRVVEISMTDLAFTPDVVGVTAGETVTFVLKNDGVLPHEFRLSNAHRIEEHIASGHEHHDEGGDHHADADVFLELDPGEHGELTVTFPEDVTFFTEIACLIPGHYESGMKGIVNYL